MGSRVKRAPNQVPIAVAIAKNQACSENWDPGEKGRQITAHRQAGAKSGNNTASDGLDNADSATRHAQLNVICPQRGGKTAAEHADNHHSVDAG